MGVATPFVKARWRKWDVRVALLLVVVPIAIYGIPSALGHPNLPGDDYLQNFPLRVLAGQQLRSGALPTFDPYIWGGAPLLGGWNAGALYPFTMLFAALPSGAAWALNEMAVYWVGGLGMYAFLRHLGLRPLAGLLGAATFAYAGSLDVQLVHYGLVAGESWIPLLLLAALKLRAPIGRWARLTWVSAFGVCGAMVVLAGEPRAIDTALIVVLLYAMWLASRPGPGRLFFAGSLAGGLALAALISAVQWVPGAMAIATSQRAASTYALFGAGSLYPRWLALLFVPNLLGGSGFSGTSSWFASYSLAEVMGYAGLAAVAAATGMLGLHVWRRPLPQWLVWEAMTVLGVLLALGTNTPLGHLLMHLPLYGGQRLQSRNLAIVDLALSVLLAYWAEEVIRRWSAPVWARPDRFQLLSVLPVAAAAVFGVIDLISPAGIAGFLGASVDQATNAAGDRPLIAVSVAFALALATAILWFPRASSARRGVALAVFVVIDLVSFNLTSLWPIATGLTPPTRSGVAASVPTSAATPQAIRVATSLGFSGRYVIYNPEHLGSEKLVPLPVPDVNVDSGRFTAQGYSSIVDARYAGSTGTHQANGKGFETLSPGALQKGLLSQLATTVLVTLPSYLVVQAGPSPIRGDATPGPPPSGSRLVAPGAATRWYFGQTLRVTTVSVPVHAPRLGSAELQVGLLDRAGSVMWQPEARVSAGSQSIEFRIALPTPAIGLVVASERYTHHLGTPVIGTTEGEYTASGQLTDALSLGWSFAGNIGQYAYFVNERAKPPLRLMAMPGSSLQGASLHSLSGPRLAPSSAAVSSPHGVQVVRAVTWLEGWQATWHPVRGRLTSLQVRRVGLVQAVTVPAGRGIVNWTYAGPGVRAGVIATLCGLAVLVVWAVLLVRRRGRPRDVGVTGS